MKALLLALLLPFTAQAGLPPTSVQGSAGSGYGTTFQFNFPYIPVTQTGVNASFGQIPLATGVSGNLPVTNLNSGTSAGATTFWRGDGSWGTPAGTVYSFGAFGATPNSNGGSISGSTITLQPADGTNPGGVSTTTQTLAGAKSFSSTPTFSTMTVGSVLFAGTSGILAQDNANFFWDATNHRLGLRRSPQNILDVYNSTDDIFLGSLNLIGMANTANATWGFYPSNGNTLGFYNKGLNGTSFQLSYLGEVQIGSAILRAPDAQLVIETNPNLVSGGATATAAPTVVISLMASQTGNPLEFRAHDHTTVLSKVDTTGKSFWANLAVTGLSTGIAHVDSSGNFTSSAVDLSGADATGILAAGRFPALTGDITTSSGALATTLKNTGAGAGSCTNCSVTFDAQGRETTYSSATTTGSGSTVLATSPTMTNPVVGTQSTGDNSTKAASTAFVQTALAQLNPAAAVKAASTANIPGTYTNAVGGVCIGDTFQVTATTAFAPDGVTLTVGQRFLMKDQTSGFQNGVWTLTTAANVGVLGALLTRALDWDSSADMNAGSLIPVISGTTNSNTVWYQTAAITTCNSDSQVYTQFSGGGGGGCVAPVLTKTTDYAVVTGDFTCANKEIMVEMNCSADCTLTFPAASNSGYKIATINIGTATETATLAGSDTFGSTADQTWIMPPGGSPQMSTVFRANGGSRWNGF